MGSKSFIIPNDKDIFCVSCFEDKIATKCIKCKNVLTSGGVTFRGEPWHKVNIKTDNIYPHDMYFRSVSYVLGVRFSWRDKSLPAEKINHTVLTVLENCLPRDVPAVPSQSLVKGAPGK